MLVDNGSPSCTCVKLQVMLQFELCMIIKSYAKRWACILLVRFTCSVYAPRLSDMCVFTPETLSLWCPKNVDLEHHTIHDGVDSHVNNILTKRWAWIFLVRFICSVYAQRLSVMCVFTHVKHCHCDVKKLLILDTIQYTLVLIHNESGVVGRGLSMSSAPLWFG